MAKKQGKNKEYIGKGHPPTLTRFKPGFSGNPEGRPKGVHNRSTIAKKILSMVANMPQNIVKDLKHFFPEIESRMSIEEIMGLAQASKAIVKKDYYAYIALMDSAYGKPKETLEVQEEDPAEKMTEEQIEKALEQRGYVKK